MPKKDPSHCASTFEAVQDGRTHIELINHPFLFKDKASPTEYGAGLKQRGTFILSTTSWRRALISVFAPEAGTALLNTHSN